MVVAVVAMAVAVAVAECEKGPKLTTQLLYSIVHTDRLQHVICKG
jgi:hypothetical protein